MTDRVGFVSTEEEQREQMTKNVEQIKMAIIDTPRTDGAMKDWDDVRRESVSVAFARMLERELAEAKGKLDVIGSSFPWTPTADGKCHLTEVENAVKQFNDMNIELVSAYNQIEMEKTAYAFLKKRLDIAVKAMQGCGYSCWGEYERNIETSDAKRGREE